MFVLRQIGSSWRLVLGFATLAVLGGLPGPSGEQERSAAQISESERKGIVTYVEGNAEKQATGEPEWQRAEINTGVISGEWVRTRRLSKAELTLAGLDILRMAPVTTLKVDKLYQETREAAQTTAIDVQEGNIWASVTSLDASSSFTISSPIAAAAVRGTTLRMDISGRAGTELRVYKGEVSITNAPGKPNVPVRTIQPYRIEGPRQVPGPKEITLEEWVYIVKAMQRISIRPDGRVAYTGMFKPTDPEEKTDWVKWNQQRDKQLEGQRREER